MPYTLYDNNILMAEIYNFRDKYLKEYRVKNTLISIFYIYYQFCLTFNFCNCFHRLLFFLVFIESSFYAVFDLIMTLW